MNELFLTCINMSISASWLVLAVLLLRLFFKKAPKWVNVLLWGIVAVRLICPLSFESALSLIPSAETISPTIMMDQMPSVHTGIPAINSLINPVIGDSLAPAPGASANPLQIWIPILSMIWLVGAAAFLLYTAISYWRLRRKVSEAVILRDNIYQSENVASPFVLGMIRPKVFLPYNMNEHDLVHVVAHEQAHIRRKDHWWKPLGFLLLTIHWFNPLMWLAYGLLCRDIELACDEKVIKDLGNEQRADYTQALVACSVNRRMIAACPLAFGEVGVKKRVKSVMNYRKPAFWIVLLAVITCVAVAACFLTNPIGFEFDEASHTIVSANRFDMRAADDAVTVEMNPAQISELSSRLAGVKNTQKSDEYGGFTPGYQISALLQDGTYIRVSGYSLSENDMVDIEWNGERYVVSDVEFQDYLSRICAREDVSESESAIAGKTYVYEGEGIMGIFDISLNNDGTFTYYEGMASSYIGNGSWKQEGDTLTLTDDGPGGYGLVNHFKLDGDDLVFVEQDSTNFVYVKVKDGEKFHCQGEAFKQNDGADGVEEIAAADHSEAALTKAIHDAIEKSDGLYHCESFSLLSLETVSGTPRAGTTNHKETVNVYGLALYETYEFSGYTFYDTYIPVAITFEVQDGKYTLKDYWEPRDGSYHALDILEKYPDAVEADALDTQKYIQEQKLYCYDQAIWQLRQKINE